MTVALPEYVCPECSDDLGYGENQWCAVCEDNVTPVFVGKRPLLMAESMENNTFWCEPCNETRRFHQHHDCYLAEVLERFSELGRVSDNTAAQFALLFKKLRALDARSKEPDQLGLPELVADEKVAKAVESLMARLHDLGTSMVRPLNLAVNDLEKKLSHAVDHQRTLTSDVVGLKNSLNIQGEFIVMQKKLIEKMLAEVAQLREQALVSGSIFD